jgi:hypothetical protein
MSDDHDQLPPRSTSPLRRPLPLRAAFAPRRRLEHLYNVKRTWLTISQLQSESRYLTPIPHLQWFGEGELKRQVRLLKEGFTPSPSTFKLCERSGFGSGYYEGWRW